MSDRQLRALTIVDAAVALGWVESRWPGLLPEFERLVPGMLMIRDELDGVAMLGRADALARSDSELRCHPLLGSLPFDPSVRRGLLRSLQRMYGQMPWSSKRTLARAIHTIPVAGQGGDRNPNLPPSSRPDHDDGEIRSDRRPGIPYPEWNVWTQRFLPNHVAVLERKNTSRPGPVSSGSAELRRWFEQHTHRAMKDRLEDGSDLDVDRYVDSFASRAANEAIEARLFRDLRPAARDVTTAVLLDGSASLGAHRGRAFQLELACADALSRAMSLARERHGLFVFSGDTRHRVDVLCLKDFDEPRFVAPSALGLVTGGYTRLGAPLRHLTSRLLTQPSARRLLIVIGDGLLSDEGYEGRYAWADGAHAVEEATDAGVLVYYVGIGPTRVDPLPDVFGARRSTRIRRVEELPRVLAHVHRELVAA
jgi:nitric oxide reductase activation protein